MGEKKPQPPAPFDRAEREYLWKKREDRPVWTYSLTALIGMLYRYEATVVELERLLRIGEEQLRLATELAIEDGEDEEEMGEVLELCAEMRQQLEGKGDE